MCLSRLFARLFGRKPKPVPVPVKDDPPMLQVNELSGFGGGGAGLTLTQKGYGYIDGANSTANLAMSYANVSGGSAPAAGDLVVWFVFAMDNAAQAINTISGWTQNSRYANTLLCSSVLAKVVSASDIASPDTVVTSPTSHSSAMWIAYTVAGSITTLTVNGHDSEYTGGSLPSNDAQDSTSLTDAQYAVTLSFATGTDGAISLSWSGATPDIQFQRTNIGSGTTDIEYAAKISAGGISVTISKSDADGTTQTLASAYVTVA